jgi:uncharacterized protein YceK
MPRTATSHLRLVPIMVLMVAILAGCSTVRIAYYGADFFIHQYANDYLGLDSDRLAAWQPHLDAALARHKAEELPYLARFFDNALRGAERGFDRAGVACLQDQLLVIYRRHAKLMVDLAVPLLAISGPDQIHTLEAKFREDWEDETGTDPEAVARRERKRSERYEEASRWWVGGLRPAQEAIIQTATAAMPDTAPAWDAYRWSRQKGLLKLLRQGSDEARLRVYLTDWLVDLRDLPTSLIKARQGIYDAIGNLVVRLDGSLSPEQKERLTQRLRGLRDDFLSLQTRPHQSGQICN